MKIFKDNKPPVTSHQLPENRQKNKNWKLETGGSIRVLPLLSF